LNAVQKSFTLLPPAPHLYQECAVEHEPWAPHNAQSLYYQTQFNLRHGRRATWADAMAHCSEPVDIAAHGLALEEFDRRARAGEDPDFEDLWAKHICRILDRFWPAPKEGS
jgi:hypothetical protein